MRAFLSLLIFGAVLYGCASSATTALAPPTMGGAVHAASLSVTPFNAPASVFPGVTSTEPTGIRPGLITATVTLQDGATVGGVYERKSQTWFQIDYPDGASSAAYGPETIPGGYRVVGSFKDSLQNGDSGFVYDSVKDEYLPINAPPHLCTPKPCNYTIAHSIFGGAPYRVVGNYDADAKSSEISGHAFLYESTGKKFTTIDVRGAISTTAYGIWMNGQHIVVAGGYTDKTGRHAYVRDLSSKKFVTYDYPGAALTHFEGITGAGGLGNYNLVGDYTKPKNKAVYGFYLQIRNWKPWPPVVIGKLTANSVSDHDVIGVYNPGGGISGFITTVPIQDPP